MSYKSQIVRGLAVIGISLGTFFGAKEWVRPGDSPSEMDSTFQGAMELVRYFADVPIYVNSGFRNLHWNRVVGGSKNSAHTKGVAGDFKAENGSMRYKIVRGAMDVNYFLAAQQVLYCYTDTATADSLALEIVLMDHYFNRIGIASWGIHLDADTTKPQNVIWTY